MHACGLEPTFDLIIKAKRPSQFFRSLGSAFVCSTFIKARTAKSQPDALDMKSEAYTLRDANKLRGGDHFCGLFHSEEEQLANLAHFVEDGLRTNCKVILIQPDHDLSPIKAHTSKQVSSEMDEALAKGQLVLENPQEHFFRNGLFSAESMMEHLLKMEVKALQEGYRLLFISGQPSWIVNAPSEYFMQFVR